MDLVTAIALPPLPPMGFVAMVVALGQVELPEYLTLVTQESSALCPGLPLELHQATLAQWVALALATTVRLLDRLLALTPSGGIHNGVSFLPVPLLQ